MEKSAINKIEKVFFLLLKCLLSAFLGFLTSKIGIKGDISPFSISVLSLSPHTSLSFISMLIGIFLGYITKDFSIYNYKYICANIILFAIILISGKNFYKKMYTPFLPAAVCFFVGFIFLFAENFTIVLFLLLICETIICGCATYFIKYVFDSFKERRKLKSKDLISLNITIIILLCALDNYYIFITPLSFVFAIILVYLCCYYLDRKTALLFTSTLCAVPAVLHPTNSFYFILLYIPAVVCVIISKFEKKHIVTSYVLSFLSMYTMNIQNLSFGIIFSPIYAAIVYILLPKKTIENTLREYITVYDTQSAGTDCEELCQRYNQASIDLLNKIENVTVNPVVDTAMENKIKRFMHLNKCKDISISNFYSESGKQIITVQCKNEKGFSTQKLKNKICKICNNNFVVNKEIVDESGFFCRFEQTENYKIECFALYKAKKGEAICGDNVTAFKCANGFYYLILADGMGSGKEAYNKSLNAITLIKKLLKSGTELCCALETVNSALDILKDGVGFSTVDVCKISLENGEAEFVKCGAINSYIIRNKKIFSINGGGFPAGLNENVSYTKKIFSLKSDDIIVMASDGISIPKEKLQTILLLNENGTIESIAKNIIDATHAQTSDNIDDDMSVLVASVKKHYTE